VYSSYKKSYNEENCNSFKSARVHDDGMKAKCNKGMKILKLNAVLNVQR